MNQFNAYAATFARGPLKPFSFDPGELGPEEVDSADYGDVPDVEG